MITSDLVVVVVYWWSAREWNLLDLIKADEPIRALKSRLKMGLLLFARMGEKNQFQTG